MSGSAIQRASKRLTTLPWESIAMTKSTAIKPVVGLLAITLATLPAVAAATGTSIRITATGMKSAAGEVSCALYRGASGFPNKPEQAVRRVIAPIRDAMATCVFEDVPPGPAAVSVYHDANANKKLDLRFGIIPRESIGASNNLKARLGPPKYDAARFLVGELPIALTVTLQQP